MSNATVPEADRQFKATRKPEPLSRGEQRRLNKLLDLPLTDRERMIVLLHVHERLSLEDIAPLATMTIGHVRELWHSVQVKHQVRREREQRISRESRHSKRSVKRA